MEGAGANLEKEFRGPNDLASKVVKRLVFTIQLSVFCHFLISHCFECSLKQAFLAKQIKFSCFSHFISFLLSFINFLRGK